MEDGTLSSCITSDCEGLFDAPICSGVLESPDFESLLEILASLGLDFEVLFEGFDSSIIVLDSVFEFLFEDLAPSFVLEIEVLWGTLPSFVILNSDLEILLESDLCGVLDSLDGG